MSARIITLRRRIAGATAAGLLAGSGFAAAQTPPPAEVIPIPVADPVAEVVPAQGSQSSPLASSNITGNPADPRVPDAPGELDWKKIPRVRPAPRLGFYQNPPTGPGYYTLLDAVRGDESKGPPKWPYPRVGPIPPPFFDLDNFSYLDDPKNTEFDYTDPLHRIRHGDWLYVTGGEMRGRYENRVNDRLQNFDNEFSIGRIRTYHDFWYKDDFRFYVEGIFAGVAGQDLAPLAVDQQPGDFLNLFVDLKVAEWGGDPAYVRVGRQELLFGSQRLISPLDWVNARRTFQGVRGFRQTEKWDVDLFWVQPVVPNQNRLDSVDNNQNFAGAWSTYRPKKGVAIDTYYLYLDNTNRVVQQGIVKSPFSRHTFGGRLVGNEDQVLYDAEGAMQWGGQGGRGVVAGMATVGAGYWLKDTKWNPTVWAYYDYASGGGASDGTVHTFNQLFPFGHYYLGWIDQVGRQNIHDLNFHTYVYPTKWLTGWVQFHSFWLANKQDALYNAAGNVSRRDASGRAGSHVGEELDLVANFHLTTHTDLFTGYSYLWGGDFLKNTAGKTGATNASFYFLQLSYKW